MAFHPRYDEAFDFVGCPRLGDLGFEFLQASANVVHLSFVNGGEPLLHILS
jgi:hypothetical protein